MTQNPEAFDGDYRRIEDDARNVAGLFSGLFPDQTTSGALADADAVFAQDRNLGFAPDGDVSGFPSVRYRAAYNQEVANGRPPVYSSSGFREGDADDKKDAFTRFLDPAIGLDGCELPFGILEIEDDVDWAMGDTSAATWLVCSSSEQAAEYVARVGATHSDEPGGDGQGRYTTRTIHENPWFVADTPSM